MEKYNDPWENLLKDMGINIVTNFGTGSSTNKVSISETEESITFLFPIPGVRKDTINITFKNNVLTVTNEDSEFVDNVDFSFEFDYDVEVDMVEAFLEDGVLTIVVDKPEDNSFEVIVE